MGVFSQMEDAPVVSHFLSPGSRERSGHMVARTWVLAGRWCLGARFRSLGVSFRVLVFRQVILKRGHVLQRDGTGPLLVGDCSPFGGLHSDMRYWIPLAMTWPNLSLEPTAAAPCAFNGGGKFTAAWLHRGVAASGCGSVLCYSPTE
jgi:hypothetical protein